MTKKKDDPASTTDARGPKGRWKPGQSGNPAGKAPQNVSRRLLMENAERLTSKAIEKALEGDTAALNLCLSRIAPALKQQAAPIQLEMPATDNLLDQAQRILKATTDGELPPDIATQLMQTLTTTAKVKEVDDLDRRLTKLEGSLKNERIA